MIQAYFKGKLEIQDNCIKKNEDLKTSSSIGLLQYLPDDVFWKIMRKSCKDSKDFPAKDFGKIKSFIFWQHNDPTGTRNKNYVEPDVWIETENYDVIIEVKEKDEKSTYPQSKEQWEDQIQSVKNEQNKSNDVKPIVLIALGGNEKMRQEWVSNCPVYKASWYDLLNAIVKVKEEQNTNGFVCRVLDDVIGWFARQGVMKIQWMNTLPQSDVNERVLDLWRNVLWERKKNSIIGFSTIQRESINEIIIQKWNPID